MLAITYNVLVSTQAQTIKQCFVFFVFLLFRGIFQVVEDVTPILYSSNEPKVSYTVMKLKATLAVNTKLSL